MKALRFLFILVPLWAYAHDHAPSEPHHGTDTELNLRVFKKWAQVNWLLDIKYANRDHEDNHKAFTLGGKYRLLTNLKVGAYVSRQFGNRHDNDWVLSSGEWFWQKTDSRGETIAIVDIVPRALLDFLPGERWVGEFRVRYLNNFFNDQNTIKLRPRLTYFWFRNGKPFMNLFAQYEVYLPMDYGEKTIYEKWAYLGGIYHLNKWFKPGFYIAHKSMSWTSSDKALEKRPAQPYDVTHEAYVYGLNLIFRLP